MLYILGDWNPIPFSRPDLFPKRCIAYSHTHTHISFETDGVGILVLVFAGAILLPVLYTVDEIANVYWM